MTRSPTRAQCRAIQGLLEVAAQHLALLEAIEGEIAALVGATPEDEMAADIISDVVYSGAPIERLLARLALTAAARSVEE